MNLLQLDCILEFIFRLSAAFSIRWPNAWVVLDATLMLSCKLPLIGHDSILADRYRNVVYSIDLFLL